MSTLYCTKVTLIAPLYTVFPQQYVSLQNYLCLTMSAEVIESKLVRRPSVTSIISERIAWISFKVYLLVTLGHTGRFSFFFN